MRKLQPTIIASIVVLIFGVGLFYTGTDGFRAYTAETARVHRLVDDQPSFPEVQMEDSFGREYGISEFEDKYIFITFLYTACMSVCPQLEYNMAQVYDQLPEKYIGEDIVFLSISFDPERDEPETLNTYKDYFGSDGETWRMVRVQDEDELSRLLDTFGVIVIPDGEGNFAHNSAFYLVDPHRKLIDVMDYQEVDEAASKLNSILKEEEGES